MHLIFLLLIFCKLKIHNSSLGDSDPRYRKCIELCYKQECVDLLQIDICSEDCEYKCMMNITYSKRKGNIPVVKYYGHWPFVRIFGFQEPASALFSAMNCLPHIYNTLFRRYRFWKPQYPMSNFIILHSIISVFTWAASTLYHYHRTELSERVDLCSAFLFISFSTWMAMYNLISLQDRHFIFQISSAIFYFTLVLFQIFRIWNRTCTFTEHVHLSIFLVICHSTLWMLWAFLSDAPWSLKKHCITLQICLLAAGLFEIFDFPPIYDILDAHAVWHAATIPIGFSWYNFWSEHSKLYDRVSTSCALSERSLLREVSAGGDGYKSSESFRKCD